MPLTDSKLQALRAVMHETHKSGVHLSYEWRRKQLQQMRAALSNHQDEWVAALAADLGKERNEALGTEVLFCQSEIDHCLRNLRKWMAPDIVPSPVHCAVGFSRIEHRPLLAPGVLIVGPSNYPCQLTLIPAVGALMGGNPVLLKPSELCPATSSLTKKLLEQYLEPGAVQVVEGGVKETTMLLEQSWGMVFFTGSERVGRVVAQTTAKTLTPTVLELGGKAPVVVDETAPANLEVVANRIVWGKTINAGQTCVGPDYVVCHQKHVDRLCAELVKSLERQFTKDPQSSELGRLVQARHADRLVSMLKEVEGHKATRVLCGGSGACNARERYVAPTFVLNPPRDCRLLTEEIFGPILPIIVVESREEAIDFINERPGTPLAMYVFTSCELVYRQMVDRCPAASGMRNDCVMFFGSSHLPVGGLGSSGYGEYHGKHSFDTFTHKYSTVYRPAVAGSDLGMLRGHPLQGIKGRMMMTLLKVPDIPVFHLRAVLVVLGLGAVLFYMPIASPVTTRMGEFVAGVLENAASWIRGSLEKV